MTGLIIPPERQRRKGFGTFWEKWEKGRNGRETKRESGGALRRILREKKETQPEAGRAVGGSRRPRAGKDV